MSSQDGSGAGFKNGQNARENHQGRSPGADEQGKAVGVPGKRAPTDGMRAPGTEARLRISVALARAQLATTRADHLPRLRASIEDRSMVEARTAAGDLERALTTAAREAEAARQLGGDVDALVAELESLRTDAAPDLALAPPPAPPPPDTPWALAYSPPSGEELDAERTNEANWNERLDVHAAHRNEEPSNLIHAADRFAPRVAEAGVNGVGGPLPHLDAIQRSFGHHNISAIDAHVGGQAASAATAIGAEAYATGSKVAFSSAPTLLVAAHEAAHVVQQRAGVQLLGGVGDAGDRYENHADEVASIVVAGGSAETVLDRFTGSSGTGPAAAPAVQLMPLMPAQVTIGREAEKQGKEQALENEDQKTKVRRMVLLNNIRDQLSGVFDLLFTGADKFIDGMMASPPRIKKSAVVMDLLEVATSAAIGGAIGVTANTVAKTLTGKGLKDLAERGITDGLKEAVKESMKKGAATKVDAIDTELLKEFANIHRVKLDAARSAFLDDYWTERAEQLYALELDDLEAVSSAAAARAQDTTYAEMQARSTAVEWVNFVARAHHGELTWDPWQGEDGAAGRGRETDHTRKGKEAAQGNVDPSGVQNLLDDDQRKGEDDHHGLLEIHLWLDEDGYSRYTGDSEQGLRLDNVHPDAKKKLKELGTVANAHVNKIVRVYKYLGSGEINPRPPAANIFVTADGYIRNWASTDHLSLDDARMRQAVEFAESLPMSLLE